MSDIRIELTLTKEEAERLEIMSWFDDDGPNGEGWQTPTMHALGEKVRKAIAAAKSGEPPTVEWNHL